MKNNMNIYLLTILIIIFIYICNNNIWELFRPLYFGFDPSRVSIDKKCVPENDCFPGSYLRTEIYHNMCEPNYGLMKQKIKLQDTCQKSLSGKLMCLVNKDLSRKCGGLQYP